MNIERPYPGYGYVELTPNLNDCYDPETGEEIYVPSNYPFDIPRVYIEGLIDNAYFDIDAIIAVRDNKVITYEYYTAYGGDFCIVEYNLETLQKTKYSVTRPFYSRMDMLDYDRLLKYIDPNLIKKINNTEDDIPTPAN